MTQKRLFEMVGAPLANSRWSWGAVRADRSVVLRVWKDAVRVLDGKSYVCVLHGAKAVAGSRELGLRERAEHVALIRGGAPCYMVMCEAEDTSARPRHVKYFNQAEVFPGGAVAEVAGDTLVELLPPKPIAELGST